MRCTASASTPAGWSSNTARTTCSSPRTTSRTWSSRSAVCPSTAFPPPHTTVDRGHGRIEHRTVRAAPAPDDVDFPGVRQVMEILRHTTNLDGSNPRTTVEYGVTSLADARAGPARLGTLARGHWSIEVLHHAGYTNIAAATRRMNRDTERALVLLGV